MGCLNSFQQADSHSKILKNFTWINILLLVQKDVFSKLILNILKSYKNYTMRTAISSRQNKNQMRKVFQLPIKNGWSLLHPNFIGNIKKLVYNLVDKEKYVIHYENLQLYLRLGLKLKINTSCIRSGLQS